MTSELPPHLRAYQTTLYAALESDDTLAVRDASPLDQLSRLAETTLPLVVDEPSTQATMLALGAVGSWPDVPTALQAAEDLFGSSESFGEAIYLGRSLARESGMSLALVRARRYLEEAFIPSLQADLTTDRQALLTLTTFTQLWSTDARHASAVSNIEGWRWRFVAAYTSAHEANRRAFTTVADTVDEMAPRVEAIERLNTLRRLGAPVALTSLDQYHELERVYACSIEPRALRDALVDAPVCPECRFEVGDSAPTLAARRVRQSIDRGLTSQQRRLSQRVIMRLLSQTQATEEERLARFIEVVQASDLNGLALVLDDELLEFLRRLLDPTPAEPDIIDRLAMSFPEITLDNLDDAVAEVRHLLSDDIAQAGGLLRIRARSS